MGVGVNYEIQIDIFQAFRGVPRNVVVVSFGKVNSTVRRERFSKTETFTPQG
jgi:hypothetical protein